MGQARQRGNYAVRVKAAIKRNKADFVKAMGDSDPESAEMLRAGINPFLALMSENKWQRRKAEIINYLNDNQQKVSLEKAKSIRVQEDEIGWYLFLCEQALEDPLCLDVSQLSRSAPFIAGIGSRWQFAHQVKGIEKKLREILNQYKSQPDGLLFEILVALSYAAKGWEVELLDQIPNSKSPDMLVSKDGVDIYVECKRFVRRTSYSEQERNDFLKLWDEARHLLLLNKQWVWLKGIFHVEISTLPKDFLVKIFQKSLPISSGEVLIYDDVEATIYARLIDQDAVHQHLANFQVKANSPMLNQLLGGDWAPMNSSTTIAHNVKVAYVNGCDAPVLGTYIQDMNWACGFTRDFDSPLSLDKKAKDITSLLSEAVLQVPDDKLSIIHIAAETLEGNEVEKLRTLKVMNSIPSFITGKPVLAVRFHRFQANQTVDKFWEFDETVERFQIDLLPQLELDIPVSVVIPNGKGYMQKGSHWELYP